MDTFGSLAYSRQMMLKCSEIDNLVYSCKHEDCIAQ